MVCVLIKAELVVKCFWGSLEGVVDITVAILAFNYELLLRFLALGLVVALANVLVESFAAEFARGDIGLILPETFAAQHLVKNFDRLKRHPGSNFNEHKLLDVTLLSELLLVLIHYLVNSEPNAVVKHRKRQNVVDKRLAFWMVLWSVENLYEHLFD